MLATWVEISRTALLSNIWQLRRLQGQGEFGVVVKSNAYGHDMLVISSLVEDLLEVTWLCTAGVEEALLLRAAGCTKKILAMAYHNDAAPRDFIGQNIDVMVDDLDSVKELNACATNVKARIRVHVKVDTGLSRRGIMPHAVIGFIGALQSQCPAIELVGIFTHLADTSTADTVSMREQLDLFNTVLQNLSLVGITLPYTHAFSSGVLTALPPTRDGNADLNYTMVRAGTHVYGLWKSELQKQRVLAHDPMFKLCPVLTWKARIMDVVEVPAGTGIGYEHTFVTQRVSRIATVAVGYADGYPRSLSQQASVIIDGRAAPLVGLVSMNMLAVDVTAISDASRGSIVILMGEPPGVEINNHALQAGTINNELLTHICPSIKRIVVD